ncbi:DedA family protein [bacterium]|nr:DedA family protein [candidate division CSSED10-310 bacterium]
MVGTKTPELPPAAPGNKPGLLRRIYDWVLHWAETPYGPLALFILSFAESSFFPIPPDVLLIALAISIPTKAFRYALVCYLGSILGGIAGYGIGVFAMDTLGAWIIETYHAQPVVDKLQFWFDKYGFWGVLVAAVTPIPYKVFTISSGSFELPFTEFMAASLIGRGARFFAVAGLIYAFGAQIKSFIDKYFNILSILFVLLLLLGFLLVKYV